MAKVNVEQPSNLGVLGLAMDLAPVQSCSHVPSLNFCPVSPCLRVSVSPGLRVFRSPSCSAFICVSLSYWRQRQQRQMQLVIYGSHACAAFSLVCKLRLLICKAATTKKIIKSKTKTKKTAKINCKNCARLQFIIIFRRLPFRRPGTSLSANGNDKQTAFKTNRRPFSRSSPHGLSAAAHGQPPTSCTGCGLSCQRLRLHWRLTATDAHIKIIRFVDDDDDDGADGNAVNAMKSAQMECVSLCCGF